MIENINANHQTISSEELMAWLAEKSDRLQGDMRDAMDLTDSRGKAAEELGLIKSSLKNAKEDKDWNEVKLHLDKFIGAHGSDPCFKELIPELTTLRAALEPQAQKPISIPFTNRTTPQPPKFVAPDTVNIEVWQDKLQGGIDRVNKSDQLQLIHIQDLNSRVAQATQLASNLMSSQQQAMSAVIHNLKA